MISNDQEYYHMDDCFDMNWGCMVLAVAIQFLVTGPCTTHNEVPFCSLCLASLSPRTPPPLQQLRDT